jgi:hypothetical protein
MNDEVRAAAERLLAEAELHRQDEGEGEEHPTLHGDILTVARAVLALSE